MGGGGALKARVAAVPSEQATCLASAAAILEGLVRAKSPTELLLGVSDAWPVSAPVFHPEEDIYGGDRWPTQTMRGDAPFESPTRGWGSPACSLLNSWTSPLKLGKAACLRPSRHCTGHDM